MKCEVEQRVLGRERDCEREWIVRLSGLRDMD